MAALLTPRRGFALIAWLCALAPFEPALAEDVAVLTVGPRDEAVLAQLRKLTSDTLVRHTLPQPNDARAVLARSKAWSERRVVIIDLDHGALHVLHSWDGAVLTRLLPDATVQESPYAVAFVLAELLGLSSQLQTLEQPPAPAPPRPYRVTLGLSAALDGQAGTGAPHLRPQLDGLLRLGPLSGSVWPALGLQLAPFGRLARDAGPEQLRVRQHDASASIGLGVSRGRLSWVPGVRLGLTYQEAELLGSGPADRALVGWLGLGLQMRVQLLDSLVLLAAIELRFTPLSTRFVWQGRDVVELGGLGAGASLGLGWSDGG